MFLKGIISQIDFVASYTGTFYTNSTIVVPKQLISSPKVRLFYFSIYIEPPAEAIINATLQSYHRLLLYPPTLPSTIKQTKAVLAAAARPKLSSTLLPAKTMYPRRRPLKLPSPPSKVFALALATIERRGSVGFFCRRRQQRKLQRIPNGNVDGDGARRPRITGTSKL